MATGKYRGRTVELGKPMRSDRKDKAQKVYVKNPKTGNINVIHFGEPGSRPNQTKEQRKAWLARHSKITKKNGNKAINDRMSPLYWAKKIRWPANQRGIKK